MKTLMNASPSFASARGPRHLHRRVTEPNRTGLPLRRAAILVLLVLSFALSLSILVRARNEVLLNPPRDHEVTAVDPIGP